MNKKASFAHYLPDTVGPITKRLNNLDVIDTLGGWRGGCGYKHDVIDTLGGCGSNLEMICGSVGRSSNNGLLCKAPCS